VAEETSEPVRKSDPSPAVAKNPPETPAGPIKEAAKEPVKESAEPAKGTTDGQAQEGRSAPKPEPKVTQPAPTITLHGTDSPSDARAWGNRILPAAPDAIFHNRPPVYPREASQNGQHGTVVVVIHISPSGQAASVDVVNSSGYVLLDSAARDAVMRWRFLPAVKDGQPVASEMRMSFVFDFN
jgi:protein TonB